MEAFFLSHPIKKDTCKDEMMRNDHSQESGIKSLLPQGQIEPQHLEAILARSEPHADGLTSVILRARLPEHIALQQSDAIPGWLALDRKSVV